MSICKQITTIQNTIRRTALARDRDPESIKLIAVSKKQSLEKIRAAYSCGQRVFGENYLQEAREKISACPSDICWHFIGHLQSNKAASAVELFDVIQTVDRAKIVKKIQHHAKRIGKRQNILVQVNVGREKQKSGILPENAEDLLGTIQRQPNVQVLGLMTMPPWTDDPEKSRPYFRKLRELASKLAKKGLFADPDHVALSMGMSGDYTVAIEEGATMVRVGTAIFGTRL
jgi:pyridoxal phosphate enzyme (YggS family)